MSTGEVPSPAEVSGRVSALWVLLSGALAALGVAGFLAALGSDPRRAWQAYLVNFLFWTGLAFGSVLVSAALTMSEARWGRPVKRLAEAPVGFLPLTVVLLLVMYFGRTELFPWIPSPQPAKAWWLRAGFLLGRNAAGLSLLGLLGIALVACSVRRDLSAGAGRCRRGESILSPVFGLLYAVVLSLLAFDLVMSLDEHWFSTVFGAYYFTTSFYTALTALVIGGALAARSEALGPYIGAKELRDLGILTFGFCVASAYLFYCQYLTIWYGNIPHETGFLLVRYRNAPWEALSWGSVALAFGVPFVVLLSRRVKSKPNAMAGLAVLTLVGLWLERFVLVAPSLWKGGGVSLGWVEVVVTLGFLGLMGLCVTVFLRLLPMLAVGDPVLAESLARRAREAAR